MDRNGLLKDTTERESFCDVYPNDRGCNYLPYLDENGLAERPTGTGTTEQTGTQRLPTSFVGAKAIAQKGMTDIAKTTKWSKDCTNLFTTLGTNGTDVTARAAQGFEFRDGITSTDLRSGLYSYSPLAANAAQSYGTESVADYFMTASPSIKAATTLNSWGIDGANVIYLNATFWGSDYYADRGTVLHELLHSITGLTDSDFETKFGSTQKFRDAVSKCNY
jgi:hypothetical protein